MFDTLAILKNLFGVNVMLTSSTSHVPGEVTECMHDLRDRDADAEKFAHELVIRSNDVIVGGTG